MTRRRVLYVIDHQRPGRDDWSKPETSTASVELTGDLAAREIAARFRLRDTPVVQAGSRIRVRVWPEPEGLEDVLAHDTDIEPAEGIWNYGPEATR
jgi:hypothetical protein